MFQDPYTGFQQMSLPNGLTLFLKECPQVSWCYVGAVIHAGAHKDPAGREGLAHLVEHVISENVVPLTYTQLKQQFEKLGGNGWFGKTSYLSSKYSFHFPADEESIQQALVLFGQMLLLGKLCQKIEEEKKVILCEHHRTYSHELARTWALQGRPFLFENHPRLRSFASVDGIPNEFMASTQDEIQIFYDRFYVPGNMSLVCIGQLNSQTFLRLLHESPFSTLKPGKRTAFPTPFLVHSPQKNECFISLSQFSTLARSDATCSFEWVVPLHFPRQCVRLFCDMLETQLNAELRHQRHLTYGVLVDYEYYQDCRTILVSLEVSSDAIPIVRESIWRVLKSLSHAEELFLETKKALLFSLWRIDYSGYDLLQAAMDDLENHQRLLPFTEEIQQIEQTRFSLIQELTEYLTPERHFCFILHP